MVMVVALKGLRVASGQPKSLTNEPETQKVAKYQGWLPVANVVVHRREVLGIGDRRGSPLVVVGMWGGGVEGAEGGVSVVVVAVVVFEEAECGDDGESGHDDEELEEVRVLVVALVNQDLKISIGIKSGGGLRLRYLGGGEGRKGARALKTQYGSTPLLLSFHQTVQQFSNSSAPASVFSLRTPEFRLILLNKEGEENTNGFILLGKFIKNGFILFYAVCFYASCL